MTKTETIKTLEKRYKVHIDKDEYWDFWGQREAESFKIYSADGCKWSNVLGYRSLVHTLKEDKEKLMRIARRAN